MRFSTIAAALLPSIVLADGYGGYGAASAASAAPQYTTEKIYSTTTRTVERVMTAYQTYSKNSTMAYPTAHSSTYVKPIATGSVTVSAPAQVTTNAAPRGAVDAILAGVAGAAVYLVL